MGNWYQVRKNIIKLDSKLSVMNERDGLCYGLTSMWIQSIWCGEQQKFRDRLEKLSNGDIDPDTLGKEELLDIKAFTEGLVLNMSPEFFGIPTELEDPIRRQHFEKTFELTKPIPLEAKKVKLLMQLTIAGTQQMLADLLDKLKQNLTGGPHTFFVCSKIHAMGLCLINEEFTLFDQDLDSASNNYYFESNQTIDVAKQICKSFSQEDICCNLDLLTVADSNLDQKQSDRRNSLPDLFQELTERQWQNTIEYLNTNTDLQDNIGAILTQGSRSIDQLQVYIQQLSHVSIEDLSGWLGCSGDVDGLKSILSNEQIMVKIKPDGSVIHFDMPPSGQKNIPINRNIIKKLLCNACGYGQQEMLAFLIKSVSISDFCDYERPLYWAIKKRKNEVVKTLLCNNFKRPNHGRILHSTTRDCLAKSYYQILTQKVSSIPTEPQERNKFILAAAEFKEDICQLLLDEVETLQNGNSLDQAIALLTGVLGLESGDNQDLNVLELVMKVDRPFSAMGFHWTSRYSIVSQDRTHKSTQRQKLLDKYNELRSPRNDLQP